MLISFKEADGAILSMFSSTPDVEAAVYDSMVGDLPTGHRIVMTDAPMQNVALMYVSAFTPDPDVNYSAVLATLSERPAVAHGWAATGTAPMTLDMAALPSGTAVTATNEGGESVATSDAADPITLDDPETYVMRIDPPFPYMPSTLTIEVT